jgi:hypothetical protein
MRSLNSRTSCQNVIKTKIKAFRDAELLNNQQYIRLRRRAPSQQQRRHNPNTGSISNLISHWINQFYFLPKKCVYMFCVVLRTNHHYFTKWQYLSSSSSSIGTTTLRWVSACSTIVEHSQQEGFTECRFQRHFKPPNLEENQGFRAFQLSPQEAPSVWSDASEPSSGRWNYGREIAENFCRKCDFHVTFGFFYMP